ncbi:hypothetical protein KBY88_02290 [Cyanobium sp. Morenito 9A2]|nr:hypothetical protein [Cyanobium sp. Morenito 9A2]
MELLQGWHLPLLQDSAFVDLQHLLQRALLLRAPERLLSWLAPRRPLAPQVLVASWGPDRLLGLVVSQRSNRSGSCWELRHLRLAEHGGPVAPDQPSRLSVETALLREAIQRSRGAASWITSASSLDDDRLALLRQQGFQPQRTETLWRWSPKARASQRVGWPAELQLCPLQRRNAPLLWHLEQAACPAHLRQLLDRRVEDLLDHTSSPSLLLIDPSRAQAVAAVRRLRHEPGDPLPELEITLHPGWEHLLGSAVEPLLSQVASGMEVVRLRSDVLDQPRNGWLRGLGLRPEGEEVLMARSVWRRQEPQPSHQAARRLEAMLESWQPRRRPLPTPVLQPR